MTGKILEFLGKSKLELGPFDDPEGINGWAMERDSDGIAWLFLNVPDSSANTVGEDVLRGLNEHLEQLEKDLPRALVIRSAKKEGFVAGADINQFLQSGDEIESMLREGHDVVDRLAALDCPTIAVVHGYALGAGFEVALACDHRIAIDGAYFGFPEVRLGLHPGLGGTFRLTGLIDPTEAMTMMLTGKSAHTKKARTLGIVSVVTEERHVRNAVKSIADGKGSKEGLDLKGHSFRLKPVRSVAARTMRSETQKKAPRQYYPAPFALIDLWEEHGGSAKDMQDAEIRSFAHLLQTDASRNLVRDFFLREKLKKHGHGDSKIAHVHVVGAGAMGADIAALAAIKGFSVSLFDVSAKALGRAVANAVELCEEAHLSSIETRDALDRLIPDPRGEGVVRADLVIEAAPEKPDLKRQIYKDIEPRLKKDAILATNTSSLSLDELSKHLERPQYFAGLHFFNPVSKLELVEVVSHKKVNKTVLSRLNAFVGDIDHLPAAVSDYPGFLVNRALTPYLMEAILMMDEGLEQERIDSAAEAFGMPVGPVELADQVGLDICLHVAESLRSRLETSFPETPQWLADMVERGEIGKKAGKGFYEWKDGKPQKNATEADPDAEMQNRLVLPMLNACMECLRKEIVADRDTVDAAMIFGTGFAPFRGGPMHYAGSLGADEITSNLDQLTEKHGSRFRPDAGWTAHE